MARFEFLGMWLTMGGLVGFGPLLGALILRKREQSLDQFIVHLHDTQETTIIDEDMGKITIIDEDKENELYSEMYFRENPLESYCLPKEMEEKLPFWESLFEEMSNAGKWSGEGSDINAEWKEWNLQPA